MLLYALIVAAAEAAAHAWECRQRALAAATYARQLAEARLHVLSAQLQPHFLFNALHAISALVWEDPARADRLLARLSEMLRLTLRSGTQVETTLAEEVTLLERYAEIQEARYGDRLRVSFEVEARVRDALVPRLILQPLVENAIRHGVTRRITPGQVEVRAWQGDGRLNLTVRDDGVGLRRARCGKASDSRSPARGSGSSTAASSGSPSRPAPEGGAVCSLSIPLRMAEDAAVTAPRIRALIVDDEPLARARLRALLAKHADMQLVGECAEGGEAIAAIGRAHPEVVFLDIQMTETSGLDVADEPRGGASARRRLRHRARAVRARGVRGPRARLPAQAVRGGPVHRHARPGAHLHVRHPRTALARAPGRLLRELSTRRAELELERRARPPCRSGSRTSSWTPPPGTSAEPGSRSRSGPRSTSCWPR